MLRYQYLFSQLVRRELRQKYKGSALGVLWYFVNPLVLMALYGLMLGSVLKAVSYPDYPIFILAGLVVWLFFSQSLLSAASSLVDQSSLVSKVRFPRETVPASIVTVQLVPMIAMLVVLIPVAVVLHAHFGPALLLVVPLVVLLFAFTLGLCLIAAVSHAYFRDVQPVLAAALLPLFFVSGVLFAFGGLPGVDNHPWIGSLLRWGDPVAPFIISMRSVVYSGSAPGLATLAYVVAAAALALGAGVLVFRRFSRELAVVL
jgi:ABC-type polysaccharide/polyol phosphate export permease